VSPEGNTLHVYGSRPGDVTGLLNGPGHVSVIRPDGATQRSLILVAEYYNSRVMLFDSQLKPLRIIVDFKRRPEGQLIERPRRMSYVNDQGILLVGLAGERGVDVLRLVDYTAGLVVKY